MFRRRGGMRRSMPRNVVQSQKVVIDIAPQSLTVDKHDVIMSEGVDAIAAGQTSPVDNNVPTGSVIKFFDIQMAFNNIASTTVFLWITIQQLHNGQTGVNPRIVGGNAQRNQVFRQILRCIPQDTNVNIHIPFKIPKRYQRVREGDSWLIRYEVDGVAQSAVQVIYKYYR